MSLINNMLADLEERQAFLSEEQDLALSGLSPVNDENFHVIEATTFRFRGMVFLLLSTAILVSGGLYLKYSVDQNNDAPLLKTPVNATPDVSSATTGSLPENPSVLINQDDGSSDSLLPEITNVSLKMDFSLSNEKNTQIVKESSQDAPVIEQSLLKEDPVIEVTPAVPALVRYEVNNYEEIGTVLKLGLTESADFRIYTLNNPSRVVIEFEKFLKLPDVIPESIDNGGIVTGIRGHHTGNNRRTIIVFDLSQTGTVNLSESNDIDSGSELTIYLSTDGRKSNVAGTDNDKAESFETGAVETVYQQKEGTISVTKNSKNADEIFNSGISAYRHGKTREGLAQINQALEMEPLHEKARTTLVNILISQNKTQNAVSVLDQGIRLLPDQYDWQELKAKLLVKLDKNDEAIETLLLSGPDVNQNPEYYAFLAALLQKQGRNEEAIIYFQNVVNVNNNNGVWWMGLGISLESIGRTGEAINAYRNAIRDISVSQEIRNYIQNRLAVLSG